MRWASPTCRIVDCAEPRAEQMLPDSIHHDPRVSGCSSGDAISQFEPAAPGRPQTSRELEHFEIPRSTFSPGHAVSHEHRLFVTGSAIANARRVSGGDSWASMARVCASAPGARPSVGVKQFAAQAVEPQDVVVGRLNVGRHAMPCRTTV